MATKRKVSTNKPICIRIGGTSIVIRKLDTSTAHVVVIDAPRDQNVHVANEDIPASG